MPSGHFVRCQLLPRTRSIFRRVRNATNKKFPSSTFFSGPGKEREEKKEALSHNDHSFIPHASSCVLNISSHAPRSQSSLPRSSSRFLQRLFAPRFPVGWSSSVSGHLSGIKSRNLSWHKKPWPSLRGRAPTKVHNEPILFDELRDKRMASRPLLLELWKKEDTFTVVQLGRVPKKSLIGGEIAAYKLTFCLLFVVETGKMPGALFSVDHFFVLR